MRRVSSLCSTCSQDENSPQYIDRNIETQRQHLLDIDFHVSYLYGHSPQVGTEKEEPHELVGIDGNEVANLSYSELAHGHVGCAQTHDLVVDFGLRI